MDGSDEGALREMINRSRELQESETVCLCVLEISHVSKIQDYCVVLFELCLFEVAVG